MSNPIPAALLFSLAGPDGLGTGEHITLYGALILAIVGLLTKRVVPGWVYDWQQKRIEALEAENAELRAALRQSVGNTKEALYADPPRPAPPGGQGAPHA